MALFKCKSCGGNLVVQENASIAVCEHCGSQQTLPKTQDVNIQNMFNRANNLRLKCEFDRAADIYEKIIELDDTEAEAHWGIILCKYGIEYVEDPVDHRRVPTCHRASYDPVTKDTDYIAARDYSDTLQQAIYEAEAKAIDRIQRDILAVVRNEKPFDIFICYKETDENGKRTIDSVRANEIYYELTELGYKVFYAAITLEDKLGQAYEPYIFAALNSAKVMLVLGTKPEYFNAVWVRNEWSRFMRLMKNDRKKILIPCYLNMDAYDLPDEFSHLQAQDMSKMGAINDIIRGIQKVIKKEEPKPAATPVKPNPTTTAASAPGASVSANPKSLLTRTYLFLEDGNWNEADKYCEKVLDIDPENCDAYVAKFCVEFRLRTIDQLSNISGNANTTTNTLTNLKNSFSFLEISDENWKKIIEDISSDKKLNAIKTIRESSYAVGDLKGAKLFAEQIEAKMKTGNAKFGFKYADLVGQLELNKKILASNSYNKAVRFCKSEKGKAFCELVQNHIKQTEEEIYNRAVTDFDGASTEKDYLEVSNLFAMSNHANAKAFYDRCIEESKKCKISDAYAEASTLMKSCIVDDIKRAMTIFRSIPSYRDSSDRANECADLIDKRSKYQEALMLMKEALNDIDYFNAAVAFEEIIDFADSRSYYERCKNESIKIRQLNIANAKARYAAEYRSHMEAIEKMQSAKTKSIVFVVLKSVLIFVSLIYSLLTYGIFSSVFSAFFSPLVVIYFIYRLRKHRFLDPVLLVIHPLLIAPFMKNGLGFSVVSASGIAEDLTFVISLLLTITVIVVHLTSKGIMKPYRMINSFKFMLEINKLLTAERQKLRAFELKIFDESLGEEYITYCRTEWQNYKSSLKK